VSGAVAYIRFSESFVQLPPAQIGSLQFQKSFRLRHASETPVLPKPMLCLSTYLVPCKRSSFIFLQKLWGSKFFVVDTVTGSRKSVNSSFLKQLIHLTERFLPETHDLGQQWWPAEELTQRLGKPLSQKAHSNRQSNKKTEILHWFWLVWWRCEFNLICISAIVYQEKAKSDLIYGNTNFAGTSSCGHPNAPACLACGLSLLGKSSRQLSKEKEALSIEYG